MDYIRIKTTRLQDYKTTSIEVTELVEVPIAHSSQLTVEDIKNLLKDWIKLYPNSFAPDVEFKIYQLEDGDIIIRLHEDLSSMAVALLVLYFETTVNSQQTASATQQLSDIEAYITIDDTEVLLKQNEGKRAMIFCSQQDNKTTRQQGSAAELVEATTIKDQNTTAVRFLLEDNYVLDYSFEKRPQPVKDSNMTFEETEFSLPEEYESVRVGDVVKKKIDEILEDEGLTPKKMLMYILCAAIGLSIGFLIVYFMGK